MPTIDNPKHEAFAYQIAKGLKQKEAYTLAGYAPNDSAASRLATSPVVKRRVKELKTEIYQRINDAMDEPNEETFKSLREMGLTMTWCANAFKKIYLNAVEAGQFAPANSAVANIQKMVEIEGTGTAIVPEDDESRIKIGEVNTLLENMAKVISATRELSEPELIDIIPPEVEPVAILQHLEDLSNDPDNDT